MTFAPSEDDGGDGDPASTPAKPPVAKRPDSASSSRSRSSRGASDRGGDTASPPITLPISENRPTSHDDAGSGSESGSAAPTVAYPDPDNTPAGPESDPDLKDGNHDEDHHSDVGFGNVDLNTDYFSRFCCDTKEVIQNDMLQQERGDPASCSRKVYHVAGPWKIGHYFYMCLQSGECFLQHAVESNALTQQDLLGFCRSCV